MKKDFYIIIPFDQEENRSVKDSSFFWALKNFKETVFNSWVTTLKLKSQLRNFQKMKKWLLWRSNAVKTWLENIWIRANVIEKNELIQFLTDYYNPSLNNFTHFKQWVDKIDFVA
jgi:hypothetical protein